MRFCRRRFSWMPIAIAAIVLSVSCALPPLANAQTGAVSDWDEVTEYASRPASLQAVDFWNMRYNLGGERIALRNGAMSRRYKPIGGTEAALEHIWLFDVRGGVPRHALVSIYVLNYGGSSAPDGYALLFEIRDGRLVTSQGFGYNAQAFGTGVSLDVSSGTLTITGRSDDDTPNCCPAHLDVATFTWNGNRFLPAGYKVVPVAKQ